MLAVFERILGAGSAGLNCLEDDLPQAVQMHPDNHSQTQNIEKTCGCNLSSRRHAPTHPPSPLLPTHLLGHGVLREAEAEEHRLRDIVGGDGALATCRQAG